MMTRLRVVILTLTIITLGSSERVKRQSDAAIEDEAEEYRKLLCSDKRPGEWFRLNVGDCRDVVQCTEAGLQRLRCPHSLAFDLEQQTCNWKGQVTNCDKKVAIRKARPNLNTIDPICDAGQLACGDNSCYPREVFCDGTEDCPDGSDETQCDINSDPNRAPLCEPSCILPDCFCLNSAADTPNGRDPADIPQMITITFDDAINNNNIELYLDQIFIPQRVNPNGCSIKGTFFVSHKYTNYTAVEEIYRQGHEIAVHSISHNDSESFWSKASIDEWTREMSGAREIISNFGNVENNTVIGVRAPYLRVGGNNQYRMMENSYFIYDSTITAPLQNPPFWPYTLYHRIPHKCHGNAQNCPTRQFPIWEMVMNELDRREEPSIEEELSGCAMVDSCFSNKPTYDQFYNFLMHNFNRVYLKNRAPLGLFFHSAFLKNDHDILKAFLDWIDFILVTYPDAYFVTMTQVIQWLGEPNGGPGIDKIAQFRGWKEEGICNPSGLPHCYGGNNCKLGTPELPGETIHLSTCNVCPNYYPWLTDPKGQGSF